MKMGTKDTGVKPALWISAVLFVGAFCMLQQVLSPFSKELPAPGGSDDGQSVREILDRPRMSDVFSVSKVTFNEGTNSHYVPLMTLAYRWTFEACRDYGLSFYQINSWIHFINCMLVFMLVRMFIRSEPVTAAASLGLMFSPTVIDMLRWIAAGINHTLTLFLCLSTAIFWVRYLQKGRGADMASAAVFCGLAFLTKPVAYFLPFALLCFVPFRSVRCREGAPGPARAFMAWTVFWVSLLPFLAVEIYKYPAGDIARRWGGISFGLHPVLRTLDLLSRAVLRAETAAPVREAIMLLVAALLALAFAYALLQKKPLVLFGLAWICGSAVLMLSSNFRGIGSVLRYHYFPLAGVVCILACVADDLFGAIGRSGAWSKYEN